MPVETTVGLKRPVNLTLNEDLVNKARAYTPNLSATEHGRANTLAQHPTSGVPSSPLL